MTKSVLFGRGTSPDLITSSLFSSVASYYLNMSYMLLG